MRKKIASGIMPALLLASMLTLAFNIQAVWAEPKTWYVDDSGGKDFTRIQDAIIYASPGDTICVYNGTYYEHINIYKSLTLMGENKYGTIIDGFGYGPVVTISASRTNFTSLTVRNAGWWNWNMDNGIRLYRTRSSQVTDCIVSGCAYGIREIRQGGIGGENVINGNTVSDATEIAIGSSHPTSIGNIVANNIIKNSTNGIYFNSPYNLQIVGNHLFGTESQYSQYGIHLQVGGLNNTIIGNRVEYSDNAIRLDYADNNVVEENAVEDCTFGIFVGYESSDNIVARNNASGSIIGMMLWDNSNYNLVTNNLVINNYFGIALSSSNSNEIFHNNFIANTQQVLSDGLPNVWDDGYPSGGNYWSDYADIDLFTGPSQDELGGDGIWDHPYVIDFENRDRYPLTEPWAPTIAATVDVDPNALNLMSQGKWITAYIELPEGYDVSEIDSSKIKLYSAIYVDPNAPTELGDYDSDGIPDLMVKFNKAEVVSYIECALNIAGCGFSTVSIRITGKVLDETPFEATDTVKLLFPGDADDDGDVDFDDFIIFAGCYGTSIEDQSYHLLADFDEDKYIDFDDFIILAGNYGKTAF